MKTNQLLTFYFLLFCATTLIGQQSATLYCDIEALLDGDDPAEVCEFVEAPGENPENFTIEATLEEEITWSGQDGILITKVKWYKGPKIFNGKNPSGNGVIKAKPKKPLQMMILIATN